MASAAAIMDEEELMALSQSYLDALVAAYSSGQTSVSYDGRSVTFANGEDLRQRIREVAAGLGVADPLTAPRPASRTSVLGYVRG